MVKFGRDRHGAAEPTHQCPNMREPDALSGFVLGAGAPEKVENPLVILGIDAAAVIGNFEDRKAKLGAATDRDVAGNARLEVFERVVDQIGKDLLDCQPVAHDVRQRFDADLRFGLRSLMRHRRDDTLDQLAGVDLDRRGIRAVPRG